MADSAAMASSFSLLTWNVNSIRVRLDNVLSFLDEHQPDVACLQETRVEDRLFPRVPFMELGYKVSLNGTKGYAGVATLTKEEVDEVQSGFADPPADKHRRILAVEVQGVTIYNLYAPNGTSLESENFPYKLDWYARLRAELDAHRVGQDVIVCGDFNVIPRPEDVWDPAAFEEKLHCTSAERSALTHLTDFGLKDCFLRHQTGPGFFTFFDYQHRRWEKKEGMRIDHIYATPGLYGRCRSVVHVAEAREDEGPSDHLPVLGHFD